MSFGTIPQQRRLVEEFTFSDSATDDSHLTEREQLMHRFVRYLVDVAAQSSAFDAHPIPVLRGSLLLRLWFGEAAREAQDVDIELFDPIVSKHSRGRGPMDRRNIAVRPAWLIQMTQLALTESAHAFVPVHSEALWEYGTPGGRFTFAVQGQSEHPLQVDLASQGPYAWEELGLNELEFSGPAMLRPSEDSPSPKILGYSRELMAAAKLSWVLRSAHRIYNGASGGLQCSAQPKDVFDLHLLLRRGQLSPRELERAICLLTFGEDIAWDALDWICNPSLMGAAGVEESVWEEFFQKQRATEGCASHPIPGCASPHELLVGIAEQLPALLPTFVRPQERPFLGAIRDNPEQPIHWDVYGDWLEERGDPRSEFVREWSHWLSLPEGRPSTSRKDSVQQTRPAAWVDWLFRRRPSAQPQFHKRLADLFQRQPEPWLRRLFGTQSDYRERLGQSLDTIAEPP